MKARRYERSSARGVGRSENQNVGSSHRGPGLQIGQQRQPACGVAVVVKPECLIRGAKDEMVVGVLGQIVGPDLELGCRQRAHH